MLPLVENNFVYCYTTVHRKPFYEITEVITLDFMTERLTQEAVDCEKCVYIAAVTQGGKSTNSFLLPRAGFNLSVLMFISDIHLQRHESYFCDINGWVSLCCCAKTWSEWPHLYCPVNKHYNGKHEHDQLWMFWVYPEVQEFWVCTWIFAYALWKLILGMRTYIILQAIHITASIIHLGFQVRSWLLSYGYRPSRQLGSCELNGVF